MLKLSTIYPEGITMASLSKSSGTVKKACSCASEYQDKLYGKQIRVFNVKPSGARCTVCGKVTNPYNTK
jgi:hypothetical protein